MAEGGVVTPCDDAICMSNGGMTPPADFVPDSQFVPDPPQGNLAQYGAPSLNNSADFVPDDQFVPDADRSSTKELVKTGLEGFSEGVAGPLGTAYQRAIGNSPEDLRAREEANPLIHGAGKVAGLLVGGAGLLGKAAGLVAEGAAGRAAVENALFTAGDEVSKMIKEDPHASVQSALLHTGLAGVLGGAVGKASELGATKLAPFINDFRSTLLSKLEGMGAGAISTEAEHEISTEGSKAASNLFDKILHQGPGAAVGAGLGHSTGIPGAGYLGAYLGAKHLDKVLPAIGEKLLSSPLTASGVKASLDLAEAVVKGQTALNKAAKAVFEEGSNESLNALLPDQRSKDKLMSKVESAMTNPAEVLHEDPLAQYMPDHSVSMGATMGRAVQYLNTLRPDTAKTTPLGGDRVPTDIEKANYDRALETVEQPLSIFKRIRNGSLLPSDITAVKTVYPDIFPRLQQKLTEAMIHHVDSGKLVPYKTALTLGMLLGTPLEPSTLPQNMLANQPLAQGAPQPPQGAHKPSSRKPGVDSAKGLTKLSQSNATAGQRAEMNKGIKQ